MLVETFRQGLAAAAAATVLLVVAVVWWRRGRFARRGVAIGVLVACLAAAGIGIQSTVDLARARAAKCGPTVQRTLCR